MGLGEFHLHSGGLWLSGLGIPIPVGMEKEPHESQDEDGEHEADDGRDQRSHPFGPAEQIAGFSAFEVQIHLLEDVLGLERDDSGRLFQFLHGLKELRGRDVAEHSLGIPIPIEDLRVGDLGSDGIFTVDFVIFQLQVATARILMAVPSMTWMVVDVEGPHFLVATISLLV